MAFAQNITVGSYAEELARINQISGLSNNLSSFVIRPINVFGLSPADSSLQHLIASKNLIKNNTSLCVKLLPINLLNQYTFKKPFGYNTGTLLPNIGLQSRLSGGAFIKWGLIEIQIAPELVYAQNKSFQTFADAQSNNDSKQLLNAYYSIVNGIDAPERFGNSTLMHLYPGQSKITLNYKSIEAGLSTQNLWWGPGVQNAIMMSNSAPGFLHWTINTTKPIQTKIGSFEWQLIGGNLTESGYLPLDTTKLIYAKGMYIPKPAVSRYISGYSVNWQPKWIAGLYIGATTYDYMDKDSTYANKNIIRRLIPAITGSSAAANTVSATSIGDSQDFAYSLNFRQILPKYKAEIYFEWARNDRAGSITDFLQQPEHSTAYTVGSSRLFELPNDKLFQIKFELTHLQRPATFLVRDEPVWYVHTDAPRDGYTNQGRYLGAGIGPGSNSLMLNFGIIDRLNTYGMTLERLVHNEDLYFSAFSGSTMAYNEWVDFSDTFYTNFKLKDYLISFTATPVYTLNYQYVANSNFSFQMGVNVAYLFN